MGDEGLQALIREIAEIREEIIAAPAMSQLKLDEVHPNYRESARNLLHYLALRRRDLRLLQLHLAELGLSSLGRAESHVLATVEAVLGVLHKLAGSTWQSSSTTAPVLGFAHGERLLTEHTNCLFGDTPPERGVRIMVTMPSEAADDYLLVHNLLQQGMDCMRINCAHDDTSAWARMIEHLRRAEQAVGRSCKIAMDLGGPKLRTGPLEPGPAVVRIRPARDQFGRVVAPARVWLTATPTPPPSATDACLPVPATWLARLRVGEKVKFTDARGSRRSLKIVDATDSGCWAELTKTAYITPGLVLQHEGNGGGENDRTAAIGNFTPSANAIVLNHGDLLILTRDLTPGRPATQDSGGRVLTPAMIGCTIPEVFEDAQTGEAIWFDDGKIGGIIEKVEKDRVLVRINQIRARGEKLLGDKGINLPESNLHLPAMTAKDIEDLSFVSQHADLVELSFANTAEDVESLHQHLARLGNRQPAVVLKIETRRGFDNLPEMLLTAMRAPSCGVMIARGDLAVECGFERMAEVQEEILWICEAAHVPVIWATQVLETLSKEGMPSRAEITDAAMGHRAECVMLNKGPHVVDAVRVLDDIMQRMKAHQTKKRSMLRELHLAHTLTPTRERPVD